MDTQRMFENWFLHHKREIDSFWLNDLLKILFILEQTFLFLTLVIQKLKFLNT